MSQRAPSVAFLGVCERATQIKEGQPILWKHSVLGLKQVVLSHVFPVNLKGFQLAFAIYDSASIENTQVRILSSAKEEILRINIEPRIQRQANLDGSAHQPTIGAIVPQDYPVWSFFVFEVGETNALILHPDDYTVVIGQGAEEVTIGFLVFTHIPALPLTSEHIAAIRSSPHAAKWVRFTLGCNSCNSKLDSYAGLERNVKDEQEGWIWYQQLPDTFACSRSRTKIDLHWIRENLHGLLGQVLGNAGEVSFARLYEKSTLESICNAFASALSPDPREEDVQKFIENNPILLQQFSPQKIFHKPPLLAKYAADFGILNSKGELILIELEKPNGRLLKKDGGMSAELQHAIDQVRDWLHLVEEYRAATLECIGLKPDEVVSIRGVVIMGRDGSDTPHHLRKLKWTDLGQRITFYTYDDLLGSLVTLIQRLNEL